MDGLGVGVTVGGGVGSREGLAVVGEWVGIRSRAVGDGCCVIFFW